MSEYATAPSMVKNGTEADVSESPAMSPNNIPPERRAADAAASGRAENAKYPPAAVRPIEMAVRTIPPLK